MNYLIITSLLIILITTFIFYYYYYSLPNLNQKVKLRNNLNGINITILLIGPTNSGKTTLFSNMLYGSSSKTHTSIKENEGLITTRWISSEESTTDELSSILIPTTPSRPIHLVDIPGHSRLRTRSLVKFLPNSTGIIFVIDGMNGLSGKNVQETGEHLHVLLSLLSIYSLQNPSVPSIPLLILLTKSDLVLSSTRRPLTSTTPSASSNSTSTPTKSSTTSTTTIPSVNSNESKILNLSLERAKLSLGREMERRRLGAFGGSAQTRRIGGGGRLEGLEAISSSSSSSSSSQQAFYQKFLKFLKSSTTSSSIPITITGSSSSSSASTRLPTDESEILEEDAFPFEGTFDWDKLGLEIQWGWSGIRSSISGGVVGGGEKKGSGIVGGEGSGGERIWNWVEEVLPI